MNTLQQVYSNCWYYLQKLRTKMFLLALVVMLNNSNSYGQNNEVHQLLERLRNAVMQGDSGTLNKLTHRNLTYGHSSGLVEDKSQFIATLQNKETNFATLSFSEPTIIREQDIMVIRHIWTGKTKDKPLIELKLAVLLVWSKQAQGWELIARQAVRIMN